MDKGRISDEADACLSGYYFAHILFMVKRWFFGASA